MSREYTRFGEELRILRTRRHQTQKDMADVLGVTKSFLSAVETGKNAIPGSWIDILCDHYHLKPYPKQILEDAAKKSKTHIRIDLRGKQNFKRELAIAFEDVFEQIDEDTAEKIKLKLLDSVK